LVDKASFGLCNPWPFLNQLHIFMVTKQRYIHSSLHVAFFLPFHVHNRIKDIFKHIIFNVYDIKIMTEEVSFSIRKLPENISLYLIVDHTKTRKLLLTNLKSKYNVIELWHHIKQFLTWWYQQCNIPFNFTNKEVFFFFYTCDLLTRTVNDNKKRCFTNIC